MTPVSRGFLAYVTAQPKGRVGYHLTEWTRANSMASDALRAGYLRHRRIGLLQGFQITEAGKAYLAGEVL